MFDKENDKFIFICNDKHLQTTDMKNILRGLVENSIIVAMPQHKLGPVYTVLEAEQYIEDNEPVIIAYCDNPVTWNYDNFKSFVSNGDVDGCIVSHTGFHPHTLSSTLFAYSKTNSLGMVSEIKEKACYTDNRFKEHASSGIYYFKRGDFIKIYFRQAIQENINYNGEFYVTLVYNLLIKDGLCIYSYLNDQVLAFGTPNEVRNFEAWKIIVEGGQVKDPAEAFDCYNYWKKLHK
jgi:NDP-sugar pyrophosphorylase family protein